MVESTYDTPDPRITYNDATTILHLAWRGAASACDLLQLLIHCESVNDDAIADAWAKAHELTSSIQMIVDDH